MSIREVYTIFVSVFVNDIRTYRKICMNNDTVQKLKNIGSSEFEDLVSHFLRLTKPELASLLVTGINEIGKPIPYRVDGILFIDGNQPKCISVQSTTIDIKSLRAKWLGLPSQKGDIQKAKDEFDSWKKFRDDSDSFTFLLYLATNCSVGTDTELYKQAFGEAHKLGISLEIIDQSSLASFLDTNSDGQYLRHLYFGIPIDRISVSLLQEVCVQSLEQHKIEYEGIENTVEIERDIQQKLVQALTTRNKPLIGIEGKSGTGKSTFVRQAGNLLNTTNFPTMWMPSEVVDSEMILVNAIIAAISKFKKLTYTPPDTDLIRVISQLPNGLTIIVDDVNRTPNPEQTIKRVEGWIHNLYTRTEGEASIGSTPHIRFIVPLWSLPSDNQENSQWMILNLNNFTENERNRLSEKHTIEDTKTNESRKIIDALNGDPFWCGLVLKHITPFSSGDIQTLLRTTTDQLILETAKDIAAKAKKQVTPTMLTLALDDLIKHTLMNNQPKLDWINYQNNSVQADLILRWSNERSLGWIEISPSSYEHWHWRHDRLRDAIIGRYLAKNFNKNTTDTSLDWLSNYGLAEAWAFSLIYTHQEHQELLITLLAQHQPLALAKMLQLHLISPNTQIHKTVTERLKQSLENSELISYKTTFQSWTIFETLMHIDDPSILEITENLEPNRYIRAARFRNGNLLDGIEWLRRLSVSHFLPSGSFKMVEQTIEAFSLQGSSNKLQIANELEDLVQANVDTETILLLAGYLAWNELAMPLGLHWIGLQQPEKLQSLIEFIWMMSRCGDESTQNLLEEALSLARYLQDEPYDDPRIKRGKGKWDTFARRLEFTLPRWEITELSAQTWARGVNEEQDPEFQGILCYLARLIDHPATIEAYIHWCAINGRAFFHDNMVPHDPMMSLDIFRAEIALTSASRNHLWNIIQTSTNDSVRKYAFLTWRRYLQPAELFLLQSIKEDDLLFDDALRLRLRLLDETAIDLLLMKIETDIGEWFAYLSPFLERDEIFNTFLDKLEEALRTAILSEKVILYLPKHRIDQLIDEKNDLLLKYPKTWHFLWQTDHSQALKFVRDSITGSDPEYIRHFFTRGDFPIPISRQMLNCVVPVLSRFGEEDRIDLAHRALRAGHVDWVQQHLRHIVQNNKRLTHWITEEDIVQALNDAAQLTDEGKTEFEIWRDAPNYNLLSLSNDEVFRHYGANTSTVLKSWTTTDLTDTKIAVAARILNSIGTGQDLDWWKQLNPNDESTNIIWKDTLFYLKRRKWHT